MFRSKLAATVLIVGLGAASVAEESPAITPKPTEAPAGHYLLDAGHTRRMFSVNHLGFSATGTIWRSDFGIGFGIPAPGTTLGIGDEVAIRIEAEFINPDVSGPQLGP